MRPGVTMPSAKSRALSIVVAIATMLCRKPETCSGICSRESAQTYQFAG